MGTSRTERRTTRRPEGHLTAAARNSQTTVGREAAATRVRCPRPLRALALGAVAWTFWPAMICAQDGALDTSFGVGGIRFLLFFTGGVEYSELRDMALRPDDRVVIAGSVNVAFPGPISNYDFGIAQLEPDGDDDLSFGDRGRVLVPFDYGGPSNSGDSAWGVALDPADRIVVVGSVDRSDGSEDFGVARLWANGSVDSTFNSPLGKVAIPFDLGGSDRDNGNDVVVQPDGRIVLAGNVIGTDVDFGVARLTADGFLDGSFGGGDGKIVVSFDVAYPFHDGASSVALQPDGKIVVAGTIDVGGPGEQQKDFGVIRLWPNGTLDSSFGQPRFAGKVLIPFDLEPGLNDLASSVAIQPDGRILVAGRAQSAPADRFPDYDFAAARLLPNGLLDPEFGTGGKVVVPTSLGTFGASDIALQPDGRILLAGSGYSSTGNRDFAVVRLRRAGSLDPSFGNGGVVVLPIDATANGFDNAAAVAVQSDAKILVAGRARARWSPSEEYSYFVVARLLNDLAIFTDGFESGDTSAWSRTVP